jgi:hypothetical protein
MATSKTPWNILFTLLCGRHEKKDHSTGWPQHKYKILSQTNKQQTNNKQTKNRQKGLQA